MTQPSSKKPTRPVVFGGLAMILGGIPFLIFGGFACQSGGWPVGVPFITLGLIAEIWGLIHTVRGNRLGAKVDADTIKILGHFGVEMIPLQSVRRIIRSAEATVLVLESGEKRIDDSLFADAKARDLFLIQLRSALPGTPVGAQALTSP